MNRARLREVLTARELRLVRNWTWGTLVFYVSLALIVASLAIVTRQAAGPASAVANADHSASSTPTPDWAVGP